MLNKKTLSIISNILFIPFLLAIINILFFSYSTKEISEALLFFFTILLGLFLLFRYYWQYEKENFIKLYRRFDILSLLFLISLFLILLKPLFSVILSPLLSLGVSLLSLTIITLFFGSVMLTLKNNKKLIKLDKNPKEGGRVVFKISVIAFVALLAFAIVRSNSFLSWFSLFLMILIIIFLFILYKIQKRINNKNYSKNLYNLLRWSYLFLFICAIILIMLILGILNIVQELIIN